MSKRNKHTIPFINEAVWPCTRRNCKGSLIHYIIQYRRGGPFHNERECSDCGLIKKDPRFRRPKFNRYNKYNNQQNPKQKDNSNK